MPRRRKNTHTGILSNRYIPSLSPSFISRELSKLSTESLFNIVDLWLTLPATQPTPTRKQRRNGKTREILAKEAGKIFTDLKNNASAHKRQLIDHILVDFYSNGLNALQLAQLDIQIMVEKPQTYSWVSSRAKVVMNSMQLDQSIDSLDDFIFSLDAQSFLDQLIRNLSNLYLTHIYISRHPDLPLIIIRIQMYEYVHLKRGSESIRYRPGNKRTRRPDIISHKPYYLAIPMSSPNLIHSVTNPEDLASNLILQAVETTLSTGFRQVKLIKNHEPPVRTLEAMHILKGVSRLAHSLGSWEPYAAGTVDLGPLGKPEDDEYLKPVDIELLGTEEGKRKAISSLKFTGTISGGTEQPEKKKKKLNTGEITETNEYASKAPIQSAEFFLQDTLQKKYNEATVNDPPNIRVRLFGNDVFAGLHELSVRGVVDPCKLPSWLTGEEGLSTGTIIEKQFTKKN